ncbi:UNVERIFIED_CONTAM: hypothetical protein Slati_4494200 [Sesamum latifolium]|uniref:Uncharacterized protein n=1 Tax=Sesamum latifolium TaxID=2727402 RepID=A0AAW2ST06_9LAMI
MDVSVYRSKKGGTVSRVDTEIDYVPFPQGVLLMFDHTRNVFKLKGLRPHFIIAKLILRLKRLSWSRRDKIMSIVTSSCSSASYGCAPPLKGAIYLLCEARDPPAPSFICPRPLRSMRDKTTSASPPRVPPPRMVRHTLNGYNLSFVRDTRHPLYRCSLSFVRGT